MQKLCIGLLLLIISINCFAGFGRGGSSGSFRSSSFSSSRSYSAPRASYYSSPRPVYSRTVVNHTTVNQGSSSGGGGIMSHLGAGAIGYALGSANHPVGYAQPMVASTGVVGGGQVVQQVDTMGNPVSTVVSPGSDYGLVVILLGLIFFVLFIFLLSRIFRDTDCHHHNY